CGGCICCHLLVIVDRFTGDCCGAQLDRSGAFTARSILLRSRRLAWVGYARVVEAAQHVYKCAADLCEIGQGERTLIELAGKHPVLNAFADDLVEFLDRCGPPGAHGGFCTVGQHRECCLTATWLWARILELAL